MTCLKNDVSLFSRLFIACQNRDGDLDNFFQYENQDYPLSISIFNELRSGNKVDLLKYLEKKADSPTLSEPPQSDMVIIDGAAIVNALKPDADITFKDYAANKFIPRISKLLSNVKRIDVVFDLYLEDSLKSTPRLHRGQGQGNASGTITRFLQTGSLSFITVKTRLNCFRSWLITDTRTSNLQIKQ